LSAHSPILVVRKKEKKVSKQVR